ncbi:organic solute transporter Ostalpha-domain-containing protein [Polychytrium aggregatum]|uniref:organic solute transporter Ostalpha-domain-containing protein n=1 Tax=Polychytrium aggregatum TaxID=110093 RepID=UPI0022FDF86D|nr:organic solute transporter Ostalpha-domain-containing protein [Polychytrium aggregatum]KAI9202205.1 organic solute transporter Ostalpha-domain-containing protein [Polychytrium aggregatum]
MLSNSTALAANSTAVIDDCISAIPPTFDSGSKDFIILVVMFLCSVIFGIVASSLTAYLTVRHLQNFSQPYYQRWIVRIFFMVPIYALCSTLSLRFYWFSIYFDIIRDCYEAFVIYSFFMLLLQYLGPTHEARRQVLSSKDRVRYPFPLNCFTFSPRGNAFLLNTKIACLQYVVIRPTMTILAYAMQMAGVLCSQSMSPTHGEFWVTSINLTSVCVAMYALILFYIVIHHDIAEHKPFYKFVAVKFVVFFSFWQSILLSFLVQINVLPSTQYWAPETLSIVIQSFLIAFEMVIASLLHMYCFTWREYEIHEYSAKTSILKSFLQSVSFMDYVEDIRHAPMELQEQHRRRKEKRSKSRTPQQHTEPDNWDVSGVKGLTPRLPPHEPSHQPSAANPRFQTEDLSDSESIPDHNSEELFIPERSERGRQ